MHPCYQRQFQIPYNSSVYSANVPVDPRTMHRPRRSQGQGNADRRHGVDLRQLCVHDLRIRWRLRARSSPRCPPRCLRFPTAKYPGPPPRCSTREAITSSAWNARLGAYYPAGASSSLHTMCISSVLRDVLWLRIPCGTMVRAGSHSCMPHHSECVLHTSSTTWVSLGSTHNADSLRNRTS
jgi:hypothetical protein